MSSKLLILIDDDQDDVSFFREALQTINPDIAMKSFENGEDALKFITASRVDPSWIFLDLNTPKMNGFQFLKEMQAEDLRVAAPMIIYTTSSLERDRNISKDLGASHFITKPTRISQLISELRYVVEKL